MLKKALFYIVFIFSLAGCSSLRTAFTGIKEPVNGQTPVTEKKETRFLDQISTPVETVSANQDRRKPEKPAEVTTASAQKITYFTGSATEQATPLQLKYSLLLNTPVEEVRNSKMFEFIDDWYGTKYRLGGTTKKGIDCSAFTQYLFAAVYCISLPRTAREQYKMTNRISRTELKEGDLIFFNTRGGISHVGVYLQNNKFVHAAGSGGVMISDIFDSYWVRRFIAVGRINEHSAIASGQ